MANLGRMIGFVPILATNYDLSDVLGFVRKDLNGIGSDIRIDLLKPTRTWDKDDHWIGAKSITELDSSMLNLTVAMFGGADAVNIYIRLDEGVVANRTIKPLTSGGAKHTSVDKPTKTPILHKGADRNMISTKSIITAGHRPTLKMPYYDGRWGTKTTPGTLSSKEGSLYPYPGDPGKGVGPRAVYPTSVRWKGIKARGWTTLVRNKWEKIIPTRVQSSMDKRAREKGY
jgi:hypothetical protein